MQTLFVPDRCLLVYSVMTIVYLYWTFRNCTRLITWTNASPEQYSSNMEWIVTCASVFQAIVSIAIACVYRLGETTKVLNQMLRLYSERRSTSSSKGHKTTMLYFGTVAGLIFIRTFAVVLSRPNSFMFKETVLCLPALLIPVIVECNIVQVCVIFDDTCRQIVQDLNALCHCRQSVRDRQLKNLWEKHWKCCQLINATSKCYGLDLLINMIASMLCFIFYTYITLISAYAVTLNNPSGIFWTIGLICQLVSVSFRVVFVSYQADKLKRVVNTQYYITRLIFGLSSIMIKIV